MLLSKWLIREQVKRKDFAAKIGVSPSLITSLCNGTVWPGRDVAARIAEGTGGDVTATDFVARQASGTAPDDAQAFGGNKPRIAGADATASQASGVTIPEETAAEIADAIPPEPLLVSGIAASGR